MNKNIDKERLLKDLEMAAKGYKRSDCVPVSGSLLYDIVMLIKENEREK